MRYPQKYPQAYLRYEFTSANISFEKLEMNLIIAGELEIISNSRIKEVERSGRINLLKKMMYLNTSYDFRTLKSYYAACLNEIELGLKTWKEDFQQIEAAILSKHVPKCTLHFSKKFPTKSKDDSETTRIRSGFVLCQHKMSHTERKNCTFHYAQHICASCWQKDSKKLEHPECSSACPYTKL